MSSELTFIDSHCHLYLEQFDEDRAEVIDRAIEAGVQRMYLPNIDASTIGSMLDMEQKFPGRAIPMMGLHPGSVDDKVKDQLAIVEEWLGKRDFCAIGEIGTDHYWDKTYSSEQEQAFRRQLGWAKEMDLPVVIHSRDTLDLNISIIQDMQDGRLRGIFHCFTGTVEQARSIVDAGFFMGLGGVLTFKNSDLDKVADQIPLTRLVLETDAPYLTPAPNRGKRNESSYIPFIAKKLAEVQGVALEEVAKQTTENANMLFGYAE